MTAEVGTSLSTSAGWREACTMSEACTPEDTVDRKESGPKLCALIEALLGCVLAAASSFAVVMIGSLTPPFSLQR